MTSGPHDPRPARRVPERALPPVEIDMSGGGPPAAGRVARRVAERVAPAVEVDLSTPNLIVTAHVSRAAGPASPDSAARDILLLASALSDYETSRGGRGLRIADVRASDRTVVLTLSPVAAAGAAERLRDVADVLSKSVTDQFTPGSVDAIESTLRQATASPSGKLALARSGLDDVTAEVCF